MKQSHKDLLVFYHSLPAWLQSEFEDALSLAEQGEINDDRLALFVQDLLNRAEYARGTGPLRYLH